jgi:hypothetical protein
MKRIIIVSLLGAMLSGCVVVPGGYYSDDGYRHEYHGYYGHGYYGGYQGSWDHGQ